MLRYKLFKTRNFVSYPGIALNKGNPKTKKKPVMVLFGWLGASEKNLGKYVKMYNHLGYDTISYTAPILMTLFPWNEKQFSHKVQNDLVHLLQKEGYNDSSPLYAHLFSNNGYINFCFLARYLHYKDSTLMKQFKCTIIDSAPCHLDHNVLTRGFVGALSPKGTVNMEHMFFSPIFRSLFHFLISRIPSYKRRIDDVNNIMDNIALPSPQLYLYSSGDKMIYAEDIQKHIEGVQTNNLGQTVESRDFKTSDHVSHYKDHPQEYVETITKFLKSVGEQAK